MRIRRTVTKAGVLAIAAGVMLVGMPPPAAAEEAEAPVIAYSWYWEEAQKQEFTSPNGEKVTIETPNPFCPGAGSGTGNPAQSCAEGRLPAEVQGGDYEEPNKISAVAFDFALIPVGSTVTEFTVTFLEAKAGCFEDKDNPNVQQTCEQTDPTPNVDDKELQACVINEIFGDGDARPYPEQPRHTCSDTDAVATRKETTKIAGYDGDKENAEHVWTFDLTALAQQWTTDFTVVTGIMIYPKEPQDAGPDDEAWRVVLGGPNVKDGVTTNVVYEEPELEVDDGFGDSDTTTDDGGTTTTTTVGSGSGSTSFGDSGTSFGGGGDDIGAGGTPPVDTGAEEEPPQAAGDEGPPPVVSFPWYMWIVFLAGLIGFWLVRSVVVEAATGVRPNGVLAQIHRLNAERGAKLAAAAAAAGPLAGIAGVAKTATAKVSELLGKLKFSRKG